MKTRFPGERILAVLGAATILVLGFDGVTYAATGSSLILGSLNKASKTTTLQNTGSGPALNAVDLRIAAGTTLAVVGHTGSGKSTLVNLLPRLFDPTSGAVLLETSCAIWKG